MKSATIARPKRSAELRGAIHGRPAWLLAGPSPHSRPPMRIETLAVHAGHEVDAATAAVTPPIHLSTTFAREADGSYRGGFLYSRYANPNRSSLEHCLAALEGGEVAAAFSSGSAATMTLIQALGPNTHVIAPDDA